MLQLFHVGYEVAEIRFTFFECFQIVHQCLSFRAQCPVSSVQSVAENRLCENVSTDLSICWSSLLTGRGNQYEARVVTCRIKLL